MSLIVYLFSIPLSLYTLMGAAPPDQPLELTSKGQKHLASLGADSSEIIFASEAVSQSAWNILKKLKDGALSCQMLATKSSLEAPLQKRLEENYAEYQKAIGVTFSILTTEPLKALTQTLQAHLAHWKGHTILSPQEVAQICMQMSTDDHTPLDIHPLMCMLSFSNTAVAFPCTNASPEFTDLERLTSLGKLSHWITQRKTPTKVMFYLQTLFHGLHYLPCFVLSPHTSMEPARILAFLKDGKIPLLLYSISNQEGRNHDGAPFPDITVKADNVLADHLETVAEILQACHVWQSCFKESKPFDTLSNAYARIAQDSEPSEALSDAFNHLLTCCPVPAFSVQDFTHYMGKVTHRTQLLSEAAHALCHAVDTTRWHLSIDACTKQFLQEWYPHDLHKSSVQVCDLFTFLENVVSSDRLESMINMTAEHLSCCNMLQTLRSCTNTVVIHMVPMLALFGATSHDNTFWIYTASKQDILSAPQHAQHLLVSIFLPTLIHYMRSLQKTKK